MSIQKLTAVLAIALTLLVAGWLFYSPETDGPDDIIADCIWQQHASAWYDDNENGVRDADEHPLPGVRFLIDDVYNGFTDVGDEAVGDLSGGASLSVWLPGCPKTAFEVYVQGPAGYRLTTPSRLSEEAESYTFGLMAE